MQMKTDWEGDFPVNVITCLKRDEKILNVSFLIVQRAYSCKKKNVIVDSEIPFPEGYSWQVSENPSRLGYVMDDHT